MIAGNELRRVNEMETENLSVAIWNLFQTEAAIEKVAAYGGEEWGEWQKIRGLMVDDLLSSGVIEQWWPDGDGPSNNEDFDDMDVEEIYNLWIKIGTPGRKNNDEVTSLIKKEIRDIMGTSESLKVNEMKKVNEMNEMNEMNETDVSDLMAKIKDLHKKIDVLRQEENKSGSGNQYERLRKAMIKGLLNPEDTRGMKESTVNEVKDDDQITVTMGDKSATWSARDLVYHLAGVSNEEHPNIIEDLFNPVPAPIPAPVPDEVWDQGADESRSKSHADKMKRVNEMKDTKASRKVKYEVLILDQDGGVHEWTTYSEPQSALRAFDFLGGMPPEDRYKITKKVMKHGIGRPIDTEMTFDDLRNEADHGVSEDEANESKVVDKSLTIELLEKYGGQCNS